MPDTLPLVTLYLSERCNSRCVTCDYWRHGKRDTSLESVRRMLPSLAELQTRVVLMSGGEPLLNPEWREIADMLNREGLDLWLLTSGLSLAKHSCDVAERFQSVTVSLDGACSRTYAAIRGVDAFRKVREGVCAVVEAGVATSLRVTLQRANYHELLRFVTLARELGVSQVSFLAVDVSNAHAFARGKGSAPELALDVDDIAVLDDLLGQLESVHAADFRSGFIAESPAKLKRIRNYFAALKGLCDFPPVRCNAPEFSAVVSADGRVSPCFFISGPDAAPRAPNLRAAVTSDSMQALHEAIRAGERPECEKCVCSMWRDPARLPGEGFQLEVARNA